MRVKNIFTATLTLAATMTLTACGHGETEFDASGVFEATEVIVSAQGSGEILSLDIAEGDTVEANRPVGLIDTLQLHYNIEQLQSRLRATGARTVDISRQLASLRRQLDTAERERARFAALADAGAGNRKTVDDYDAQIATLRAQIAAQDEVLSSGNIGAGAEGGSIIAQIAQTQNLIDKCIIRSPIAGTILAKYAEAGETTTFGRPLFKVADTRNLYLRAYVTAPQLTSLKLGDEVTVLADEGATRRKEYRGKIAWISDKAEFTPKTIQTRDERANLVYAVKIAVNNDGAIKIGMYGDVKF